MFNNELPVSYHPPGAPPWVWYVFKQIPKYKKRPYESAEPYQSHHFIPEMKKKPYKRASFIEVMLPSYGVPWPVYSTSSCESHIMITAPNQQEIFFQKINEAFNE